MLDTLFNNLEHYSELIGQGKFTPVVVWWILGVTLLTMIIRAVVWMKSNDTKISQYQILSIAAVEYLFDIAVSFILVALMKSSEPVMNYIVGPSIGIIFGLLSEFYLMSRYGNKLVEKQPDEKSSTVTNITINNMEDADDMMPAKYRKPIFDNIIHQAIHDSTSSGKQSETGPLEDSVRELASGLAATVQMVQDVAEQLSEMKQAVSNIQDQVNHVTASVDNIHQEIEENTAIECRVRILRFNIDLVMAKRSNESLPKDLFEQTIIDIDKYDNYCSKHPEFKNKITVAAEKHILSEYDKGIENGFLVY